MTSDMAGEDTEIVDRVHGLSDIELAVLLSLISHQHCVIGTPEDAVEDLVDEVGLVALNVFGLRSAVVGCHEDTTLEDFAAALLVPLTAPPVSNGRNGQQHQHQQAHPASTTTATIDYFHISPARRPSQSSYTQGPRSPRSPMSNLPTGGTVASASAASAVSASASATPTVMANVVIAKNLNCAPEAVQIQALELMRTRHILTATAVQPTPKPFLLVAVVAAERGFLWDAAGADANGVKTAPETPTHGPKSERAPHMTAHLNDFFSIGHWHDPEDGYPNIEERDEVTLGGEDNDGEFYQDDIGTDSDSIVRFSESGRHGRIASRPQQPKSQPQPQQPLPPPLFSEADVDHLASLAAKVRVDIEVLRYQMNIVAFLRIHRAVAVVGPGMSGLSCVSPRATKHFEKLAQCLAPLHRLDYVTPALVALAARKTYLHRIRTVPVGHSGARLAAVHERSMQWGGEKAAVEALLQGVSPEDVIEGVLESVAPPV